MGEDVRAEDTPMGVLRRWLSPLAGRSVLDIGCGGGAIARQLAAEGAQVTGVDPGPEALATARAAVPQARFEAAGGEALPFEAASFDAAIFVNSLHHVPVPLMRAALTEALRVSRGPVIVIEPSAQGPFFEAMRPVEDETEIRAAALAALDTAQQDCTLRVVEEMTFDDVRRFPDVDAFLAKVVAVDPSRADAARAAAPQVADLMARWGTPEDGQIRLVQPHVALRLARAAGL